jgi:hypothetical protein
MIRRLWCIRTAKAEAHVVCTQWRTKDFFSGMWGRGLTNPIADRGLRERGSGGGSSLVSGSAQFANEWNPYSYRDVMDVFSTELGIRLSFVKTSEFRGGGWTPQLPLGTPLSVPCSYQDRWSCLGNFAKSNVLLEIRLSGLFTSCFCTVCPVHLVWVRLNMWMGEELTC